MARSGQQPSGPAGRRERVRDYPRPPALEMARRRVKLVLAATVIGETDEVALVKETFHPPVYFIPPEAIRQDLLRPVPRTTQCEWKGRARYFDLVVGDRVAPSAAFTYLDPTPRFEAIRGWLSFYAGLLDQVTVDGEVVTPQEGGFYSGWITSELVGPFKGAPGTWGW